MSFEFVQLVVMAKNVTMVEAGFWVPPDPMLNVLLEPVGVRGFINCRLASFSGKYISTLLAVTMLKAMWPGWRPASLGELLNFSGANPKIHESLNIIAPNILIDGKMPMISRIPPNPILGPFDGWGKTLALIYPGIMGENDRLLFCLK